MANKKLVVLVLIVIFSLMLTGFGACSSEADVASQNLRVAAEQFRLARKVFFYNGITGEYIYTMEGLCSIEDQNIQVEVTCKVGEDKDGNNLFLKHLQGLSDNITYTVIQLSAEPVDEYQFKILIRPETIIPDFEVDLDRLDKGD